jgi:hypothetical protein
MLCLSYYCLHLLFNKIGGKGRTYSAWKQGGWMERGREQGARGRNGPNNVSTYEYMNKEKRFENQFQPEVYFVILIFSLFLYYYFNRELKMLQGSSLGGLELTQFSSFDTFHFQVSL